MTTGADKLFGKEADEHSFKQGFSHKINVYHLVRSSCQAVLSRSAKHGRSVYQTEKYNAEYGDDNRKHPLSIINFVATLP